MNKVNCNRFQNTIKDSIKKDSSMMNILKIVRELNLPDCWIGAGFIRNKIWNTLHNIDTENIHRDIDVIFFDQEKTSIEYESLIKTKLIKADNSQNWEVINQARTHKWHSHSKYNNCEEAISHWIETATSIAIKVNEKDEIQIIAPHGLEDLKNLILRPVPSLINLSLFNKRRESKNWIHTWPRLKVMNNF